MNFLKVYQAQQVENKWVLNEEVGKLKLNYDDQSHRFIFHKESRTFSVEAEHDPFKNHDYNVMSSGGDLVGSGYFVKQDLETFIHLKMRESELNYIVHVSSKKREKAA